MYPYTCYSLSNIFRKRMFMFIFSDNVLIWHTHNVSIMTEWPPLSLFSNYAFDVHTHNVSKMPEWPLLSLFLDYAFDVQTV